MVPQLIQHFNTFKAIAGTLYAIGRHNASINIGVLSGNQEDIAKLSAQDQAAVELVTLIFDQMVDSLAQKSDYELGKLEGRLLFEIVQFFGGGEANEISKVTLLTKLSEIQWIRETPELMNVINKLLGEAQDAKSVMGMMGKAKGTTSERIFAVAEHVETTEALTGWPLVQKVLQDTPAEKLNPAMAESVQKLLIDAYKQGERPTIKQLYEAAGARWDPSVGKNGAWVDGKLKALGVQNHHTAVISWAEKILGRDLTQAEKDSMPGILLMQTKHTGALSEGGFHAILGNVPGNAKKGVLLQKLERAYTKWDPQEGPTIWAAAKDWLQSMGAK